MHQRANQAITNDNQLCVPFCMLLAGSFAMQLIVDKPWSLDMARSSVEMWRQSHSTVFMWSVSWIHYTVIRISELAQQLG